MKIGLIAPGIWNSIHLDTARAWAELGHEVAIYSEDARAPSGSTFLRFREGRIDYFVIHHVRRNPWTWILDRLAKPWLGRRFFTTLVAIGRYLRATRDCDLYFVEGDWIGYFVLLLAGIVRFRWVVCIHDPDFLRTSLTFQGQPRNAWRQSVKLRVLRGANLVRANSYVTRDLLIEGGCNAERIRVVPLHITDWMRVDDIVDMAAFKTKSRAEAFDAHGIPANDRLIITMCRLVPVKGLDLAVRGFARAARQRPGLRLMICGGDRIIPGVGSYREQLENIATEEGIADLVIFTGNIDIRKVKGYLAAADLQLAPSVIDTFNYGALEAALVNTHTLASEMVGAGPWVQDAGFATIVQGRDPEIWGRAIHARLDQAHDGSTANPIAATLAPQRIASMLLAVAREVASAPPAR